MEKPVGNRWGWRWICEIKSGTQGATGKMFRIQLPGIEPGSSAWEAEIVTT